MLSDYSGKNIICLLNGRHIKEWGDNETPFKTSPIDPKGTLKRGRGGSALKYRRENEGRKVNLLLLPGGNDSSYASGLYNSGVDINITLVVIGTGEKFVHDEGVFVQIGEIGRAGEGVTDDDFEIDFNKFYPVLGNA